MRKREEINDQSSCLNKAEPHEMLFVLLGRDPAAANTIRHWVCRRIEMGKNHADDPKMREALACADVIDEENGVIQY